MQKQSLRHSQNIVCKAFKLLKGKMRNAVNALQGCSILTNLIQILLLVLAQFKFKNKMNVFLQLVKYNIRYKILFSRTDTKTVKKSKKFIISVTDYQNLGTFFGALSSF